MSEHASGEWTLRCDGGARGNPGPGALAYVLFDPAGLEVEARGAYLGSVTNNTAEYRGLIAGLEAAKRRGVERLRVCLDSELVVRQMTGEYRVKHAGTQAAPRRGARGGSGASWPCASGSAARRECARGSVGERDAG